MRRTTLAALAAGAALAVPALAQAGQGGIPTESSCGYGRGGSGGTAYQDPPQSFGCTRGSSAGSQYANGHNGANGRGHMAQAGPGTLRLGPFREVQNERFDVQHDADNSHSASPGDSFDARLELYRGRRRVAIVRVHSTIVSLQGSQAQLHDTYVITFRRTRTQRGGHLYGTYDHAEDFTAQPRVGDIDRLPVTRGDGRFAGYTGEVASRVVRVARNGRPFFRDTITLTRAPS